jgi:hypothetical protein
VLAEDGVVTGSGSDTLDGGDGDGGGARRWHAGGTAGDAGI